MHRRLWIGSAVVGLAGLGAVAAPRVPEVRAQKARVEPSSWEYKVSVLTYNPGERTGDEGRAVAYERAINDLARQGWEPVGSVLSRDTVQTVGGGVTTRETTSFVAYRRPKR